MDQLNRIPEITDHVLSGLKADQCLKQRILETAASSPRKVSFRPRTIVALCSLSVLLILLCVFVAGLAGKNPSGDIQVISAGSRRNSSPANLQTIIEKASDLIQEQVPETGSP